MVRLKSGYGDALMQLLLRHSTVLNIQAVSYAKFFPALAVTLSAVMIEFRQNRHSLSEEEGTHLRTFMTMILITLGQRHEDCLPNPIPIAFTTRLPMTSARPKYTIETFQQRWSRSRLLRSKYHGCLCCGKGQVGGEDQEKASSCWDAVALSLTARKLALLLIGLNTRRYVML